MRTIETNGTIDKEGNLVVPMPDDIPQGEHRVVVVIDVPEQTSELPEEKPQKLKTWPPPGFNVFNFEASGPTPSLRRKDLYDTDRG